MNTRIVFYGMLIFFLGFLAAVMYAHLCFENLDSGLKTTRQSFYNVSQLMVPESQVLVYAI